MPNELTRKQKSESTSELLHRPALLQAMRKVLPEHVTPERLVRMMLDCAITAPRIHDCTRESQITAILKCAELGLEPGGSLGHVYLIPYENKRRGVYELKPMIGYKGYAELANRSGKLKALAAEAFYQDELDRGLVKIRKSPAEVLHEWSPSVNRDPANLVGAYAVAQLMTGGRVVKVLDRTEILQRRPAKLKSDSPWNAHPEAMWRKTAMRALLSSGLVPLSPKMEHAIGLPDPTITEPDESFEQIDSAAILADLGASDAAG